MFPVGGIGVMVLGAVAGLALAALLAPGAVRRFGRVSALAGLALVWWVAVIGLVTLLPAEGAPGIVSAEGRLPTCSWDVGGPAPDGFWIFDGAQRTLNTVLFVPAGALLVVLAARWRTGWLLAPGGLGLLAAYSAGIEWVQLELARLDRACDVTDVVDNVTGAAVGCALGALLVPLLRPWRERRRPGPAHVGRLVP